jgi:hypothetical protein
MPGPAREPHQAVELPEPTFRVKILEAELDLQVYPVISPVSIGDRPVR